MKKILINSDKYNGRYVAIRDFDDATVLGDGKEPLEAYEQAIKKGCSDPVIVFVPYKGMVQIYCVVVKS